MGGFTNTKYASTIANLVAASDAKLNNPYYKFSDKKPTPTTYYKQNIKKTTLDQGSQLQYAHVSTQSAIKYNKILGFFLFDVDRITVDYDVGENGVEAAPITGDAIVLPNTIEPLPGDFFTIDYIKEDALFMVDHVTPDTLDTGANIYKIEYHLELTKAKAQIEQQVVNTFKFIAEFVGTEYNCLITSEGYDLASALEEVISQLVVYYNSIFYKSRVQTYVYKKDGIFNFYDPFMIEFIRRNKIFTRKDGEFFYVAHQTRPEITFPLDYGRSIFYAIEKGDISVLTDGNIGTADLITDINSLFTSRIEDYYQVNYVDCSKYKTRFEVLPKTLIDAVKFNKKFDSSNDASIYNLIVSYMNGEEDYVDTSIVDQIHKLDYTDNQTTFYLIPIYIFILRNYINSNLLTSQTIN